MKIVGLIPARYASIRFPAKALALLAGRPMVLHVLEAARAARRLDRVAVATDDERIAETVRAAGGEAVMTSPDCSSGTDRLAEAAGAIPADVYVNVQGDEPLMASENIDRAVDALLAAPGREIASVWVPLDAKESADANAVKVAVAQDGRALYFSRAPIPFPRSGPAVYRKHLGLYAYRAATLRKIARLPPSPLERAESLEQLRWLEAGYEIWMAEAASDSIGVDTPEDLSRAEEWMREAREARA
ncbi:MAG: 3-deoxy-manno-octulosonate cytidylyltransferase [Acidobacteriota bacterium]|nr:3-deoxy-manno-octulosonate cytidylyltransferase [Acidobacteriota bacterium]MDQ2978804.1 3-deoxy-manno-octulosonate cytidylyltransferase [Acidobacteriota bacterium]